MAELRVGRILLLMISLAKGLESTKLLAPLKKCGDLECETLISRVIAMRDYTGPDCRYLNFTEGEEISVYVKLSGEREDLWAGSKGKDFGFFPRDAVQIEEVFISEEVEISTKESDFLCLFEEGYIFGSENNELNSDNDEDANEQTYSIYDSDLQTEPGFAATSHSMLFEDQFSASEAPETTRGASESKDWGEGEAGDGKQEVDTAPPALRVPEGQGWFGLGTGQAEEKASEPVTEPLRESSFQRRKLAMEDEHDLEKFNGEPQTEHERGPESELASEPLEFSSVQEERLELGWESEHIPKSQPSGWFGGGFTSYLGFGEENTGLELLSTESNPPLPDVPTAIPSAEEAQVPRTEVFTEKEEATVNDNSTLSPGWFDFGLGMLGFASANENKIISDDGKHEDDLTASEFDPEKDHETKMMKIMELEEEIDKELDLEKRDNSDSTPYLNFFYSFDNPWSFQNVPEETELKISRQIPDQKNIVENDEMEKLSVKNPTDDTEDATILESRYSQSDMVSKMRIHEEINFETPSSKSDNEPSKSPAASEGPTLEDGDGSGSEESAPTDSWMVSQSQIPPKEDASDFHVLKCLFQTDCGFMAVAFSPIVILTEMVVAALPEDMRPGLSPSAFSWELVTCVVTVGLFAVLLFLWRGYRSIRSRFYVGREKKLALKLSVLIEEKCKLLEKVSLVQKEYEGLESSLKDASFEKESTEAQSLEFVEGSEISEAAYEKLERSKSKLEDEILVLEKELQEEKLKHSEQDELMADISKRIQSLEDESKSLKSQVAEAKTTFRVFQINEERLKGAIKDALNENSQLQESQKQLLQEVEGMEEQVSELSKQKIAFEESKAHAEQVLSDRANHVKSLIERLLKMRDWATVLGEDIADDGNFELEMKNESEHDAHLDNPPSGALKKLIYAAKLNASLKTLEGERNQIYTQLSEVDKTKEDLTEHIESLQAEQASLQSESTQFESEKQKLEQKLKVMTELYQENEMKLHRKLTAEENYRLEKEEKLSKVDERISHANEELETYRKRAKDLEEELERTIHSYQGQIISHEKKAHDNWLAARTAERNLNDLRKENAHNRQKLTDTEFKFELLEKDPYALDVPNTGFGREHSPYGPSPLGRPSSETRAFLSPPTLLEGPLRLSPLLPGGGGRGSRGPENPLDHQISNERGDSSYDRLSDPHRAPSDTGSLSPPWELDRRMMGPPPGPLYPDPGLPPKRQDRFYSNSGRLSGPGELRSFNMPSLDKVDGPVSSEMESSRNDTKDDLGNSNEPDSSLPVEREAHGPGFVPPPFPPGRDPFFPMDPRNQFVRRGPPFPPPPPGNMYGASRDYFPPRDFPGPPPPPFPMRSVNAPRGFPHYLPPRAEFFPPPPHSERRNEFPSDSVPPSNAPAAEPPESQET